MIKKIFPIVQQPFIQRHIHGTLNNTNYNKNLINSNIFLQNLICCSSDVLEGKGAVQVAITVSELFRLHSAGQLNSTKSPTRGSPRMNLSSPSSVSS